MPFTVVLTRVLNPSGRPNHMVSLPVPGPYHKTSLRPSPSKSPRVSGAALPVAASVTVPVHPVASQKLVWQRAPSQDIEKWTWSVWGLLPV